MSYHDGFRSWNTIRVFAESAREAGRSRLLGIMSQKGFVTLEAQKTTPDPGFGVGKSAVSLLMGPSPNCATLPLWGQKSFPTLATNWNLSVSGEGFLWYIQRKHSMYLFGIHSVFWFWTHHIYKHRSSHAFLFGYCFLGTLITGHPTFGCTLNCAGKNKSFRLPVETRTKTKIWQKYTGRSRINLSLNCSPWEVP